MLVYLLAACFSGDDEVLDDKESVETTPELEESEIPEGERIDDSSHSFYIRHHRLSLKSSDNTAVKQLTIDDKNSRVSFENPNKPGEMIVEIIDNEKLAQAKQRFAERVNRGGYKWFIKDVSQDLFNKFMKDGVDALSDDEIKVVGQSVSNWEFPHVVEGEVFAEILSRGAQRMGLVLFQSACEFWLKPGENETMYFQPAFNGALTLVKTNESAEIKLQNLTLLITNSESTLEAAQIDEALTLLNDRSISGSTRFVACKTILARYASSPEYLDQITNPQIRCYQGLIDLCTDEQVDAGIRYDAAIECLEVCEDAGLRRNVFDALLKLAAPADHRVSTIDWNEEGVYMPWIIEAQAAKVVVEHSSDPEQIKASYRKMLAIAREDDLTIEEDVVVNSENRKNWPAIKQGRIHEARANIAEYVVENCDDSNILKEAYETCVILIREDDLDSRSKLKVGEAVLQHSTTNYPSLFKEDVMRAMVEFCDKRSEKPRNAEGVSHEFLDRWKAGRLVAENTKDPEIQSDAFQSLANLAMDLPSDPNWLFSYKNLNLLPVSVIENAKNKAAIDTAYQAQLQWSVNTDINPYHRNTARDMLELNYDQMDEGMKYEVCIIFINYCNNGDGSEIHERRRKASFVLSHTDDKLLQASARQALEGLMSEQGISETDYEGSQEAINKSLGVRKPFEYSIE
jgi:hypothetical protein